MSVVGSAVADDLLSEVGTEVPRRKAATCRVLDENFGDHVDDLGV